MRLEGEVTVPVDLDRAREVLSNPDSMVKCLPHLASWERLSEREILAIFRLDIEGVVEYLARLRAEARIRVKQEDPGTIRYVIDGRAARAPYRGTIVLRLEDLGSRSTRIRWGSELDLGRLAAFLRAFIDVESLINRVVDDIVKGLESCLKL